MASAIEHPILRRTSNQHGCNTTVPFVMHCWSSGVKTGDNHSIWDKSQLDPGEHALLPVIGPESIFYTIDCE